MSDGVLLGRLIQSDARGFRFACTQSAIRLPKLGDLVSANIDPDDRIYGVITNISWLSDELIAQLAKAEAIEPGVLGDNQFRRSAGQFVDVLLVGYKDTIFHHSLPPRPPFSLEQIRLCNQVEATEFTLPSFAYLRLLLEAKEIIPFCDVLASHLHQTHQAHEVIGNNTWLQSAVDYLIDLLLIDYETLVGLLEALSHKGTISAVGGYNAD